MAEACEGSSTKGKLAAEDTPAKKNCALCTEICSDPRLLPCPHGDHYICKNCTHSLIPGSPETCSVCKKTYPVQSDVTPGFHGETTPSGVRNSTSGTVSVCKQCNEVISEVNCSKSAKLCESCMVTQMAAFKKAQQTVQNLTIISENAQNHVMDRTAETEMTSHVMAAEREINEAVDRMTAKLEEQRRQLHAKAAKIIQDKLEARANTQEVIASAESYVKSVSETMGHGYGNHITREEMEDITMRLNAKLKDIEAVRKAESDITDPFTECDDADICSAIKSFGSIEIQPPKTRGGSSAR